MFVRQMCPILINFVYCLLINGVSVLSICNILSVRLPFQRPNSSNTLVQAKKERRSSSLCQQTNLMQNTPRTQPNDEAKQTLGKEEPDTEERLKPSTPMMPVNSKDPRLNKVRTRSSLPLPQQPVTGWEIPKPKFSTTAIQTRKERLPKICQEAILKQKIPRLHPTEQATQTTVGDEPGPEEHIDKVVSHVPAITRVPQLSDEASCAEAATSSPLRPSQLQPQGIPLIKPNFRITKVQTRKVILPTVSQEVILKQKIPRLHPTEQATQTPGKDGPGPEENMEIGSPQESAIKKIPPSEEVSSSKVTQLHPQEMPLQRSFYNKANQTRKRAFQIYGQKAILKQKIPRFHPNEQATQTPRRDDPGPKENMEVEQLQVSVFGKVLSSDEVSSENMTTSRIVLPRLNTQVLPLQRSKTTQTKKRKIQAYGQKAILKQKIPRLLPNEQATQTP